MKNKCYPAGISNRNGDWVWQGTVVASTIKEAKKILIEFKKGMGYVGSSNVDSYFSKPTNRLPQVSGSMFIE
jgi:hypothetical protein